MKSWFELLSIWIDYKSCLSVSNLSTKLEAHCFNIKSFKIFFKVCGFCIKALHNSLITEVLNVTVSLCALHRILCRAVTSYTQESVVDLFLSACALCDHKGNAEKSLYQKLLFRIHNDFRRKVLGARLPLPSVRFPWKQYRFQKRPLLFLFFN